ncbi:hypothetical protein HaLaN_32701, partial [Haematococcus lacustris]
QSKIRDLKARLKGYEEVERYLPLELLHKAGLLPAELPYPSVS